MQHAHDRAGIRVHAHHIHGDRHIHGDDRVCDDQHMHSVRHDVCHGIRRGVHVLGNDGLPLKCRRHDVHQGLCGLLHGCVHCIHDVHRVPDHAFVHYNGSI